MKSCQCKEVYAGVYNVSVNVTQYKEAAVREAEIPEIPRPGKIPQAPPHPVPANQTAYDQSDEPFRSWHKGYGTPLAPVNPTVQNATTGRTDIFPVDPEPETDYSWTKKTTRISNISGELVETTGINWQGVKNNIKRALDEIKQKCDEFSKFGSDK